MNTFDHKDYVANPGKYRLFKTARIAAELDGFDLGACVAVHHIADRYNAFSERVEPIYATRDNHGQRRMLFGQALAGFVL